MKPMIKGVLVGLTFASLLLAQASVQENNGWDQHVKRGEHINSMGDRETAVDKAVTDGIIDEAQARIVKFMFNDGPQPDHKSANQIADAPIKSFG
jgi:hypothetical protein